jgi:hypothetical protein
VVLSLRQLGVESSQAEIPLTRVLKVERGTSNAAAVLVIDVKSPFLYASRANYIRSSFELSFPFAMMIKLVVILMRKRWWWNSNLTGGPDTELAG